MPSLWILTNIDVKFQSVIHGFSIFYCHCLCLNYLMIWIWMNIQSIMYTADAIIPPKDSNLLVPIEVLTRIILRSITYFIEM